jgi:hypothetical protein
VAAKRQLNPQTVSDGLAARKFTKERFVLIVLSQDTATLRAAKAMKIADRVLVVPADAKPGWVAKTIAKHPRKTVAVLGHIEDGAHVVRDAKGEAVLRVPIADIERAAKLSQCTLTDFGCHSALDAGVGAATKFNSVTAIKQIDAAIESTNFLELLQKVVSPEVKMVVDDAAVAAKTDRVEATVYAPAKDNVEELTEVATVTVTFSDAVAAERHPPTFARAEGGSVWQTN